jgi:hypothetical protein
LIYTGDSTVIPGLLDSTNKFFGSSYRLDDDFGGSKTPSFFPVVNNPQLETWHREAADQLRILRASKGEELRLNSRGTGRTSPVEKEEVKPNFVLPKFAHDVTASARNELPPTKLTELTLHSKSKPKKSSEALSYSMNTAESFFPTSPQV